MRLFSRGRLSQLPPHVPLRLRHQRVWLQAQSHHRLHRRDVLPGPGQRPQKGDERNGRRSRAANGRRQLQKWLNGGRSWTLCNGYGCRETRQNIATGLAALQRQGCGYHASETKLNLFQRLISALKCCRPPP